jgi:hypothetical protein
MVGYVGPAGGLSTRLTALIGIYVPLFILAIHVLSRRRKLAGIKFLMAASCGMAVLGTAQMGLTLATLVVIALRVHELVQPSIDVSISPTNLLSTNQLLAMFAAQGYILVINK